VKVLLTGVQGQVGWELERALQPVGEVVALDRNALDLANEQSVRQALLRHRPQWVINPAAYTQVDQAGRRGRRKGRQCRRCQGDGSDLCRNHATCYYSTDYASTAKEVPTAKTTGRIHSVRMGEQNCRAKRPCASG
jgi:dTDP-4-dehydrorhamnose reductase